MQEEEEKLGERKTTRKRVPRQPCEQRSIFRSAIGADTASTEGSERRHVAIKLKNGKLLAFWVARESSTRPVPRTVVPRKPTEEWKADDVAS